MINNNRKYGYWLALGLGIVIILAFYGKYIFNANEYLYGDYEDSLKNYYTFAWHINHDFSYMHFTGMNYPYGEHIVFTDNQPLVSTALKFINHNIFDISNGVIGIGNLLLFVGLLMCIMYLYKIFFELTHNVRISVAAAIILGMLSPQIERFNGHFALAYCFVIPMFIWYSYRFFKEPSFRASRAMAIVLLLLLFVHLYYLLIVGALLLAMWLMFLIRESPRINIFTAIPHIFIQIALPLLVYFVWLKLTDNITDRPTKPYGLVEYAAHWEGLLLPLGFEYFKPLTSAFNIRKVSLETISYVGLPSLLFILWAIVTGVKRLFKKRVAKSPTAHRLDKPYNERFMVCLVWAAGIVFVYAAFVPFLFKIPWLSPYLGLLKQFRSLGRLLWVVYYGLTIFIVWYVYQKTKNKISLNWVIWSVLAVFAVEGTIYNIQQRDRKNNPYKKVNWAINKINPKNYQAIVPMPYYHEGAESIGATPNSYKIVETSLLLSLQTGIPLQGVKLSRTSLGQTLNQLEVGYEITTVPEPLHTKSKKPFLLLQYVGEKPTIPELQSITPLAKNDSFKLYSFSPKLLELFLIQRATEIEQQAQLQSNSLYIYDNYDSATATQVFAGKGGLQAAENAELNLADTACNFCNDTIAVSFWLYAKKEGLDQLKLLVNTDADNFERIQILNHIKSFNKNWMLIEYKYVPKTSRIKLKVIQDDGRAAQNIYADNLIIRAAKYDVLQVTPQFVSKNNRVLFQNTP